MQLPRLRQVVLAARDLAATAAALEQALGVREPFRDEGVGHFGLENAVYAVGDTFVEIVSPVQEGTAAGRQLDRRGGDCGYMAMFETSDAPALRRRLDEIGVRVVWDTTHDDIVDLHLHPKDVPGAIVAVDVTTPPGSWRWGGPAWTAGVPRHGPGGLLGLDVAAVDPAAAAARWAAVLGIEPLGETLALDGGGQHVRFVPAASEHEQGIIGVRVSVTTPGDPCTIANVHVERLPAVGTSGGLT
jgi:hypothetical protein